MLKIGITGGIGSGKSVVAKIFETLHISVLYADAFAKDLMQNNAEVKSELLQTFGEDIFINNALDRKRLAELVFGNKEMLGKLNQIVHPAVRKYGIEWMEAQKSAYVIKEAALFFESHSNVDMDFMIGVSAPYNLRLERAMARDNTSQEAIEARMAAQMNEDEKMKLCDFVIINDEKHSLIEQVVALHHKFLNQAQNI